MRLTWHGNKEVNTKTTLKLYIYTVYRLTMLTNPAVYRAGVSSSLNNTFFNVTLLAGMLWEG
jgi:hypothetical protein